MEWNLYALVFVVCIAVVAWLIRNRKSDYEYQLPYEKRKYLFTKAERSFYGVLMQALPEGLTLFAKIRVADIIKPMRGMGRSDWQIAFNKISAKHFDFVVCTSTNCEVIAVIELDDKSHSTEARMKRDEFLDLATYAAGVPLIRFQARSSYVLEDVKQELLILNGAGMTSAT